LYIVQNTIPALPITAFYGSSGGIRIARQILFDISSMPGGIVEIAPLILPIYQ
jgi:hypothetical protein